MMLHSVLVWLLLLELSHFHRSPGEATDGSVESHPSCRIPVGDDSIAIGTFLDFLGRPPKFCLAHFWQTGLGSLCGLQLTAPLREAVVIVRKCALKFTCTSVR